MNALKLDTRVSVPQYAVIFVFINLIQWFFDTVKEFTKLERIEIGGLKGRPLSNRIVGIYREFTENFTLFATRSYDVLDPEDHNFMIDYKIFQMKIDNLDRQLASILCQAFDECSDLDAVFKVPKNFGCFKIVL